ncbi:tetratricopeptide repeat protein (plasmid) [Pseudoalteromonas sp. T1lg65]|uniref:tetratricopeptide repeat protein n=1 Tax=Pseudoalteromonas sp. T1lg65 TaxID=2077101 RepID=UPI003F79BABE
MKTLFSLCILTSLLLTSTQALAAFDDDLLRIQKQWAVVNYEAKDDNQQRSFDELIKQTNTFVQNYPQRAEAYIWQGIVKSSYAGAKGGLGALGLAKEAKASLEKALELDKSALSGSALTSLGTLYAQVPGWPIGFGSDKKAEQLFKESLAINPQGIDVNYFYGQFLYAERKYQAAHDYLIKAQQAPRRPGRDKADDYRQKEIAALLAKVDKKLKKRK